MAKPLKEDILKSTEYKKLAKKYVKLYKAISDSFTRIENTYCLIYTEMLDLLEE